jgi:hypothetical protein
MVVINVIGPTGAYELRLVNYDVGERRLDAMIAAGSFAKLRDAVEAALSGS